jgi:carbonic anhydrase
MFDELLDANRRYSSGFELKGVPPRAARGFALVTCMDSRIEPLTMLGLVPGDAKILRNAGGRVTVDVLRSLVLAVASLGVREVAVMQHTGCALMGRTEAEVAAGIEEAAASSADGWEFLAILDPDESLRLDVESVRACPLLPVGTRVEGWRYDVETGLIDRVIRA